MERKRKYQILYNKYTHTQTQTDTQRYLISHSNVIGVGGREVEEYFYLD